MMRPKLGLVGFRRQKKFLPTPCGGWCPWVLFKGLKFLEIRHPIGTFNGPTSCLTISTGVIF